MKSSIRNLSLHAVRPSPKLLSLLLLAAGVGFGLAGGGCASTPTSDSTGQYVDDTVITTKVKSALLGDEVVKSFAVSVETVKGTVQLSGFVNTPAQKSAAGRDAWSVSGVRNVRNDLIVK